MKFSILGSTGFIGSHLQAYLKASNLECFCPGRNYVFNQTENLGHVIYGIGLTSDFRQKPMETVDAHVCKLLGFFKCARFDSFLYLSSTRVYNGIDSGNESSDLTVNPRNFNDLYNLSKLMGESICLTQSNNCIRVARLSNVIGNNFDSNNFLFSIIKESVDFRKITLKESLETSRDYIGIDDAIKLIVLIATKGEERLYNIASGNSISNGDLINKIKKYTACAVESVGASVPVKFPQIAVEKISREFSYTSSKILDHVEELVKLYKQKK